VQAFAHLRKEALPESRWISTCRERRKGAGVSQPVCGGTGNGGGAASALASLPIVDNE